jgi:hypothetical protein
LKKSNCDFNFGIFGQELHTIEGRYIKIGEIQCFLSFSESATKLKVFFQESIDLVVETPRRDYFDITVETVFDPGGVVTHLAVTRATIIFSPSTFRLIIVCVVEF